ncbi:hypothetical protein Tco_0505797 [Tanacetum coccineum]
MAGHSNFGSIAPSAPTRGLQGRKSLIPEIVGKKHFRAEARDIVPSKNLLLSDKKNPKLLPPASAPVKTVEPSFVVIAVVPISHLNCPANHDNVYRVPTFLRSGTLPVVEANTRGDKGPSCYPSCSQSTAPSITPVSHYISFEGDNVKSRIKLMNKSTNFYEIFKEDKFPRLALRLGKSFHFLIYSKLHGNHTRNLRIDSISNQWEIAKDILREEVKAITYNLDQDFSRYSANYAHMTGKQVDVIDMALLRKYSQKFFEAVSLRGLADDPDCPAYNPFYYDPEGNPASRKQF